MEFTVETSRFAEALERIRDAVDRMQTIPVLSHCPIEAEPKGLRLAAIDLEVGVRLFCPAQGITEGSGAVSVRRLLDIAGRLERPKHECGHLKMIGFESRQSGRSLSSRR